jgi:hypothetical protein
VLDGDDDGEDPAATAVQLAIEETRDAHQAAWDALSRVERVVCVALADGQPATSPRVADEHRIPRSTMQEALKRLVIDGRHVHGRPPTLVDPLFAEWLRRR